MSQLSVDGDGTTVHCVSARWGSNKFLFLSLQQQQQSVLTAQPQVSVEIYISQCIGIISYEIDVIQNISWKPFIFIRQECQLISINCNIQYCMFHQIGHFIQLLTIYNIVYIV